MVVRKITKLHSKNLVGEMPKELREKVYDYLKRNLHEMVQLDNNFYINLYNICTTLMRAIYKIGLYDRLLSEKRTFYSTRIPEDWYMSIQMNSSDVPVLLDVITYEILNQP
jgi:stalled ribosome rescue protein Dom34